MKMPMRYFNEMIMDRIAASKVYEGKKYTHHSPLAYYEKGKGSYLIHEETRTLLEYMLHMLDEKGEEFTFRFMKKYMIGKKEYPKLRKWKKKGECMTIREKTELFEKEYLSPYAALSMESKGRDKEEIPCDIRPVYQRDRDRILHCKVFRRLKHKTQVFLTPKGDHYRTRLTHTLEVAQNARTIARALRLNEDLTEAIALGHDLGHTPFGHAGERALNHICNEGLLIINRACVSWSA